MPGLVSPVLPFPGSVLSVAGTTGTATNTSGIRLSFVSAGGGAGGYNMSIGGLAVFPVAFGGNVAFGCWPRLQLAPGDDVVIEATSGDGRITIGYDLL